MDGMETEIISSENVRPSSPTPRNLRTFQLSMLDQICPPFFVHVVFYFPSTEQISDPDSFMSQTTQQLKHSLSVILTRFYPLAGRVNRDGQSIDCNDEGVPFAVVKLSGQKLSELLRNPDLKLACCLLPSDSKQGPDTSVARVQVNYFDYGGIAIGAIFSHKVADAAAIAAFLKSWASTARGSKEAVCPNYIIQSMFPHKQEKPINIGSGIEVRTGKTVARRYKFDALAISSLKSKSAVEHPTRVEVVSALIWKCFMAASLANKKTVSMLTQPVNLRRRAQPLFPSDCFGNFVIHTKATSCNEKDMELGQIVKKVRDSITKIDNGFIDRMRGDRGLLGYHENLRLISSEVPEGVDVLAMSSWCGFGLYTVDFGWGKPDWFSQNSTGNDSISPFCNSGWLMDTRNGDGIEAWVILDEKYMSVFDNVEELRALASRDPSPLDI